MEELTAERGRVLAPSGIRRPQERAIRANKAETADLDRLLDKAARVYPRGLQVHVSPDDRVVPDVNALQIIEADRVELNALADCRSPEPVEGIQDRGSSQHPESPFDRAKQLMDKEPAKVLRAPQLALLVPTPSDRPNDEERDRHGGEGHQRQPQRSGQEQLVRGQPLGGEVEQDQEGDNCHREDRRFDAEDHQL